MSHNSPPLATSRCCLGLMMAATLGLVACGDSDGSVGGQGDLTSAAAANTAAGSTLSTTATLGTAVVHTTPQPSPSTPTTDDGSPALPLGRPHNDLIGVSYLSNNPASVNDEKAITRELGLLPNISSFGGPPMYDETGMFGSVLVMGDRSRPEIEVLVFGLLTFPEPERSTVTITDVLEVVLDDDQQLSVHHIGCFGTGYSHDSVVAVIPRKSDDGGRNVPAIEAWLYTREGLRSIDPDTVTCELAGD